MTMQKSKQIEEYNIDTYGIGCDEDSLVLRRVESSPGGEFEDQSEDGPGEAVLWLIDLERSHPPVEANEDEEDDGPLHERGRQSVSLDQPPGR